MASAVSIATAYVQIVPSMQGVGNAITKAFGGAGTAGGKVAGKGFASALGAQGGIIGAASAITSKAMDVIGGSIGAAVDRADQMRNFPLVMKNLGYSSKDAAKSVQKASDAVDGLPTTLPSLTGMVQALAPLTSNLDEATDISIAFNNALLAGGKSTVMQANAMEQYTQMLSVGKVDLTAWKSIQMAMPGQMNQLAQSLLGAGKNGMDLYNAMKEGEVTFGDFQNAIVKLNKHGAKGFASFEQQAKDATQGISTAFANTKNRVAKAIQTVIEAIGVPTISNTINAVTSKFGLIGQGVANMVTGAKNWLKQLWQALQDNGATQSFQAAWDKIRDIISKIANMAVDWTHLVPPGTIAGAIKLVADALNLFLQYGGPLIPIIVRLGAAFAIYKGLTGIFTAVAGGLGTFATAIAGVKNAILLVMDLGGPAAALKEFTIEIKLATAAQNLWNNAISVVRGIKGLLVGTFSIISSTISGLTAQLWANVTALAKNAAAWTVQKAALVGSKAALVGQKVALVGSKAALVGQKVATLAVAAAQRVLNAVMSANPFVKAAIIIAALTPLLVAFFTKTELGRKIWSGFINWAKAAWQGLKEFFSNLWTGITDTFSKAAQGVKTGWSNIAGWFKDLWGGIKGAASSAADGMKAGWNTVSGWFRGVWADMGNIVSNALGSIQTAVANVWTVIGALILRPLQLVRDGINAAFVWITSSVASMIANTSGPVQAALMVFYNNLVMAWTLIQGVVNTAVNLVRTVIVAVLQLIQGDWQGAWTTVSSFFSDTWNGIVSFFAPIVESIKTTIGNMLTAVGNAWQTGWNAVKTFAQTIWDGIKSLVSTAVNAVKTTVTNVVNQIKTTWTTIWTAVKNFVTPIWDAIKKTVSDAINNAKTTISDKLNAIKSTWENIWNGVKSFVSDIWDKVKKLVSDGINNAKTNLSNTLGQIKSTWENNWNGVKTSLSRIWDGIKQAVSDGIKNVSDTVGKIKTTVLNVVSGAGSWLYDTGRQIISGLIEGIGGAMSWLKNTISNLGSSVLNWAKDVLGIHSPSRVFREQVGKQISLGMAEGIDKYASTAARSVNALTDMVPDVDLTARWTTPDGLSPTMSVTNRSVFTPDLADATGSDRQDIIDAITTALSDGVALRLNDRGGEVLAGTLARPMNYELNRLASKGR
ncbi:tape measure protein [Bifidobacterium biavatii]|uniref:Tape measure domain n=1 Tax=Bifidobacterium biavatii DSM 23969 TaxID=1437608 RepID=A0A086ZU10_9BIFI|nr:tape measure protein [Bifidobacterium biavatii]KFI50010.1 tape measure domain [Bifidobacterium biavatii DSM 23969]